MTRKEATKRIKRILEECKEYNEDDEIAACYVTSDDADALNAAIKTLEQEPCNDAISRKAMLDYQEYLYGLMPNEENFKLWEFIKNLPSVTPSHKKDEWISCSKKMPKENEYVDNVCKYYLIQDEYGDMHVAHYTNTGWRLLDSLSVLYDNVVAWRSLPEEYKVESDETPTLMREKQYCDNDREALYDAYEKGKEMIHRYYSILGPVSLGTLPDRIHVTKIHNYDYRTRVDEIQYDAWGYFETPDKLTEQECYEYDLVEGASDENMG